MKQGERKPGLDYATHTVELELVIMNLEHKSDSGLN